jgi:hypothetical protein
MDEWNEKIKRLWIIKMDDCKYLKMLTCPEDCQRSLRGIVPPLSTETPAKQRTMKN